jgi:Fe-Mn family superoxide dismutase
MAFELPELGYAYDALEPHMDARTMEIHHSKHHAGYTAKLNEAIPGPEMEGKSIEEMLCNPLNHGAKTKKGGGN